MEQSNKFNTGHIFLAVLGGGLLGAVTALLVAPKSGHDTRKQLAGYFSDTKQRLSHVPEALRSASVAAKESIVEELKGHIAPNISVNR